MQLNDLISRAEEAYHSDKNKKKQNNDREIKFRNGIGRPVHAAMLGHSMSDFFNDPMASLIAQLEWKLYAFNEIDDDEPLDLKIGTDFGIALEATLFSMDYTILEGNEVNYLGNRIKERSDLDSLEFPDYIGSGQMPRIHDMNSRMKELCGDRLEIVYPDWGRGVWSSSSILRGFNELYIDLADDPDFVHRLAQFTVDARIAFENQRCEFLGIDPRDKEYIWKYVLYRNCKNNELYEDEVDGNMFSADVYREFIFPYQKQLSDYYGGIAYYHSCGNLTPFLADIEKLNITYMLHISPWTEFAPAAEIMPKHVILQRSLHSYDDVLGADEAHMDKRIKDMVEESKGRKTEIWADAIYTGGADVIEKVKKLVKIFRKYTD